MVFEIGPAEHNVQPWISYLLSWFVVLSEYWGGILKSGNIDDARQDLKNSYVYLEHINASAIANH